MLRSPHMGTLRRVFATCIYELRVARGLTTTGLAAKTGLDQSLITRLENGVRPVRLVHLERILIALDIPVTRLPAILERVMRVELTEDDLRQEAERAAAPQTIERREHGER